MSINVLPSIRHEVKGDCSAHDNEGRSEGARNRLASLALRNTYTLANGSLTPRHMGMPFGIE